jgi:4-diphosphocytidyl-2-C-methyl-D-erythritol kinase
MLVFPNGKINLGLSILNKRADGFHTIESLLYPVPIYDALEFKTSSKFSIEIYGIPIPGNLTDNILYKTWKMLHDQYQIPPVEIKLLKGIPLGSGLGGGSSDAVFLMKNLNLYFKLDVTNETILNTAASLGSDCPFFVENSPAIIKGRGEIVQSVNLSLKGMHLVIVCPDVQISTTEAFSQIKPGKQNPQLEDVIYKPIEQWQDTLVNDFEKIAFKKYPILKTIKDTMLSNEAVYTSLTGSGAAIYGLFRQSVNMRKYFPDYFVREGILN